MDKLNYKVVYGGYKGIALDGFSVKSLNVLRNTLTKLPINFNIDENYVALEDMSLDEISSLTKKFCEDYLDIRDVMEIDLNIVNMDDIADSNTSEEFYNKVNSYLKTISSFDLHMRLLKVLGMINII